MKIYFGLHFDERPCFDFSVDADFDNLVLGPKGLLNYFKRKLGLGVDSCSENERVLAYNRVLSSNICDAFESSYSADPISFTKELLKVRDWLLIQDIDFSQLNSLRFKQIKLIESTFKDKDLNGFSDDFLKVKSLLDNFELRDDIVICHSPAFFNHSEWSSFLSGLSKVTYLNESEAKNTAVQQLLEPSAQFEKKDRVYFDTYQHEYDFIEQNLLAFLEGRNVFIGNKMGAEMDVKLNAIHGGTLGLKSKESNGFWQQLPSLLIHMLDDEVNLEVLYYLSLNKFSPFGEELAKEIRNGIQNHFSLDPKMWKGRDLNNETITSEEVEELSKGLEGMLNSFPKLEDGFIELDEVVSFLETQVAFYADLKITYEEANKERKEFIETLSCLISFLNNTNALPEKLSKANLLTWVSTFKKSKRTNYRETTTNVARWISSPFQVINGNHTAEKLYVILDDSSEPKSTTPKLLQSEWNEIESQRKDAQSKVEPMVWVRELLNVFSGFKEIHFVKLNRLNGVSTSSSFLENLLGKFYLPNTPVQHVNVSQMDGFHGVVQKDYWQIDEEYVVSKMGGFERFSSSSIDKLFLYPHEFVLEKLLRFKNRRGFLVKDAFRDKGNLAHYVIEELLTRNGSLTTTNEEIDDLCNELSLKKTPVLRLKPFKQDFIQVKEALKESIPVLADSIKRVAGNQAYEIVAEEPLEKEFLEGDFQLAGIVDLVIKVENKPIAIIDLKFSGKTKRSNELDAGFDRQLALYNYLLNDQEDIPRAYFIIDKSLIITSSPRFNSIGNVFEVKPLHEQIEKYKNAVKFRLSELNKGRVEIPQEGESYEELDFWKEFSELRSPEWSGGRLKNKYGDFNFLIK